jgi:hypothetical protein
MDVGNTNESCKFLLPLFFYKKFSFSIVYHLLEVVLLQDLCIQQELVGLKYVCQYSALTHL